MYNPLELRDDLKAKRTDDERDPFGRIRPEEKPEPAVTNLGDASKLNRPVGEQGKNDRRDVAKVETMLGRTGALDLKKTDGPTGYWGERTREATRAFQKQNGLMVDGQINPGGETIRALAKVAGGLIKSLVGNTQKAQPATQPAPRVTDAPTRHPGAGRDRGLQRAAWPTHPSPSRLQASPPYALSDDVVSENQRMARALAKRRGIGDFDRFTTDAINTDGAKAVYEIGDLIKQVRDNDPQQADALLEKTRQGIAPANVRLLARIATADGADQVTEPARRDAPAQQTPESQDARNPLLLGGAGDDVISTPESGGKSETQENKDKNRRADQKTIESHGPLRVTIRPNVNSGAVGAGGPELGGNDSASQRQKDIDAATPEKLTGKLIRLGITEQSAKDLASELSDEDLANLEQLIESMDEDDPSSIAKMMTYFSGVLMKSRKEDNILKTPGANPPRG